MSNSKVITTIMKLIVVSLVVGYIISILDITPKDILNNFGATIYDTYAFIARNLKDAADYIILGSIIVLPIWGIARFLNYLTNKGKSR